MNNPECPITLKNNTALVDRFRSSDIISLYKKQLNIDVSRFFNNLPEFYLYRCMDTGYRFYHPEGLDGDGKFYEELQNKSGAGYYHDWKPENQFAFEQLMQGDKVLDIGCGEGKFILKAREKSTDVYGIELNEKAVASARSRGLNVTGQFIQEHAKERSGFYDVVTMFQVLEHIYDVKNFLESSLQVLRKGGRLIIGVPNSEPWFNNYDKYSTLNLPPHHMGLWNIEVFKSLTSIFNIKMIKFAYDESSGIAGHVYLRAKYMAGVRTLPGHHSLSEKIKILACAFIATPLTIIKKLTTGIKGSHVVVMFIKN